jgi:hypothetical protein
MRLCLAGDNRKAENEVKCEKLLDTALRAQTSYGHGVN